MAALQSTPQVSSAVPSTESEFAWQDRAVSDEIVMVSPDELLAHPNNWTIHTHLQQAALTDTLTAIGWVDCVRVNQRTGFIFDGHLRVTLALRHSQLVPVIYYDLSEAEELQALLTINSIGRMGDISTPKFTTLMAEVGKTDEGLKIIDTLRKSMALEVAGVDEQALVGGVTPETMSDPFSEVNNYGISGEAHVAMLRFQSPTLYKVALALLGVSAAKVIDGGDFAVVHGWSAGGGGADAQLTSDGTSQHHGSQQTQAIEVKPANTGASASADTSADTSGSSNHGHV